MWTDNRVLTLLSLIEKLFRTLFSQRPSYKYDRRFFVFITIYYDGDMGLDFQENHLIYKTLYVLYSLGLGKKQKLWIYCGLSLELYSE